MRQSEPYVAKHDHEKALLLLLLLFKRWKVVIKRKDKKKNSLGKEKKNRSHLNVTAFSILVIILTAHDTCGDTLVSLHICGPQLGVARPQGDTWLCLGVSVVVMTGGPRQCCPSPHSAHNTLPTENVWLRM